MIPGPIIKEINASCENCKYLKKKIVHDYMGDYGYKYYCLYGKKEKFIGDFDDTPHWCPLLKKNLKKYLKDKFKWIIQK